MTDFFTILTAIVAILLTITVLVQNPKGGGIDSTFGGNSANQVFGAAKSADFVVKATWGLAIALLVLCVITSLLVGTGTELIDQPILPE